MQNEDWEIICNGEHSCRETTVNCPENYQCTVICTGDVYAACQFMDIFAQTSSQLNVYITPGNTDTTTPRTFEYGRIWCPNNGMFDII